MANAICVNSTKIMKSISNVDMLSLRLCEKSVIPEDLYQTLTDSKSRISTSEAFQKITSYMVNNVKHNVKIFDKFLESLKECGAKEVAEDIRKSSEPNGML